MDNQVFRFCSINNSSFVFYNKITKKSSNRVIKDKSVLNLSKSYKSTALSDKAKKQINKIVYHWANCVELNQNQKLIDKKIKRRSLSMLTLTLPSYQVVSDKECNSKYLSPFINRLKKFKPDIHYLWVAEKQKNGSIHYHIILDLFVSKLWIREIWNRVLCNGPEFKAYVDKFNKKCPPTTEIDTLKKIKNACAYITKYITKIDTKQEINCKKWDCDSRLLVLSKVVLVSKSWYIEEFAHYSSYFQIQKYSDSFFQVFTFDKHFHESFKFLNVYHDILPSLMFYYEQLYSELKLSKNKLELDKTLIRPPLISQACLDFD